MYIYIGVCVYHMYIYIYMYNLVCTYQTTNKFKRKNNPNLRRSSWGESPHRSARGLHGLYGAHLAQRHGEFGRCSPGQTHASWAHGLVGEAVGHTFLFLKSCGWKTRNCRINKSISIYIWTCQYMSITLWTYACGFSKKNERGVLFSS
jgi:hypothetical protein